MINLTPKEPHPLPFVIYVYHRLTYEYAFLSLAASALRARSQSRFDHQCRRLASEIVASKFEVATVEAGLNAMLELGALTLRRKRSGSSLTKEQSAAEITTRMRMLCRTFKTDADLCAKSIASLEAWICYMVDATQGRILTSEYVGRMTRIAVDQAVELLCSWQESDLPFSLAKSSVDLLQHLATQCSTHRIRVSFSRAAVALADAADHKAIEGPEGQFNLAIRSLISLTEVAWQSRTNLGRTPILSALTQLIATLNSRNSSRRPLSSWVITEMHELTDLLSQHRLLKYYHRRRYINAISAMRDDEIVALLRHIPGEVASQHSSWQRPITEILIASREDETIIAAYAGMLRTWRKEGDLAGLVADFEELAKQYPSRRATLIPNLLILSAKNVQTGFMDNPIVKSAFADARTARHASEPVDADASSRPTSPDISYSGPRTLVEMQGNAGEVQ